MLAMGSDSDHWLHLVVQSSAAKAEIVGLRICGRSSLLLLLLSSDMCKIRSVTTQTIGGLRHEGSPTFFQ